MGNTARMICVIPLMIGFWTAIDVHCNTPYVPWAIDWHHFSVSIAFACAAFCGVIYASAFARKTRNG